MATLLSPLYSLLEKKGQVEMVSIQANHIRKTKRRLAGLRFVGIPLPHQRTDLVVRRITRRNWNSIVSQHWWLQQTRWSPIWDSDKGREELLATGKGSISLKVCTTAYYRKLHVSKKRNNIPHSE